MVGHGRTAGPHTHTPHRHALLQPSLTRASFSLSSSRVFSSATRASPSARAVSATSSSTCVVVQSTHTHVVSAIHHYQPITSPPSSLPTSCAVRSGVLAWPPFCAGLGGVGVAKRSSNAWILARASPNCAASSAAWWVGG